MPVTPSNPVSLPGQFGNQAALGSNTGLIQVLEYENLSGEAAFNAVGSPGQTSIVFTSGAASGNGYVFEPVFNPSTINLSTDPTKNNSRTAFTFWRTTYLDMSWRQSGLGTSNVNGSDADLGTIAAVTPGATGTVEVGIRNGYYNPTAVSGSSYSPNNSIGLATDPDISTFKQLRGGYTVAAVVDSFDNTNPVIPITQGPLNNYNGFVTPVSNTNNGIPGKPLFF
jgi:hypothetical protein